MKKPLLAIATVALLITGLTAPVSAFVGFGRSNLSGLFRDLTVCTDGMQFNIGMFNDANLLDGEDFPPGSIAEFAVTENLYVTRDLSTSFSVNPALDPMIPTADTVLVDSYEAEPIANNDPFVLASNIDGTNKLIWVSEYTSAWTEPVAPGTELDVYLISPNPQARETITVEDCMLFDVHPCDTEGAIVGTENRDRLIGTAGPDIICGLGGNDIIKGQGGNDMLFGGDGRDTINGGGGKDMIYGEDGNDRLRGDNGIDTIDGGEGDDFIAGNAGRDILTGGPGNDTIRSQPNDTVFE